MVISFFFQQALSQVMRAFTSVDNALESLYPGKSDFTIKSRQAFSLGCSTQYTNRAHILVTHIGHA